MNLSQDRRLIRRNNMSLLARSSSSTNFKILEEGTHVGTCFAVIGVGRQETPWGPKEKVYIGWEIPEERVQFEEDGEEFNQPIVIWQNYTISLSNKANLRHILEGWRGRAFTKGELDGFELFNLIGKSCLLTIVHSESGDRTFANVQSIGKVMKGQEVPSQEMPAITYSPGAVEQWGEVPEWLQDKIGNQIKTDTLPPMPTENSVVESLIDVSF